MKTPHPDENTKVSTSKRRTGAPESPGANATPSLQRVLLGAAGLANEARPGSGTRCDALPARAGGGARTEPRPNDTEGADTVAQHQHSSIEPNDQPLPREPQEQPADSWAHEAERSTGVSGHMGNT